MLVGLYNPNSRVPQSSRQSRTSQLSTLRRIKTPLRFLRHAPRADPKALNLNLVIKSLKPQSHPSQPLHPKQGVSP